VRGRVPRLFVAQATRRVQPNSTVPSNPERALLLIAHGFGVCVRMPRLATANRVEQSPNPPLDAASVSAPRACSSSARIQSPGPWRFLFLLPYVCRPFLPHSPRWARENANGLAACDQRLCGRRPLTRWGPAGPFSGPTMVLACCGTYRSPGSRGATLGLSSGSLAMASAGVRASRQS
jgi:hypothetical protein